MRTLPSYAENLNENIDSDLHQKNRVTNTVKNPKFEKKKSRTKIFFDKNIQYKYQVLCL